jgi:hypothetical protein
VSGGSTFRCRHGISFHVPSTQKCPERSRCKTAGQRRSAEQPVVGARTLDAMSGIARSRVSKPRRQPFYSRQLLCTPGRRGGAAAKRTGNGVVQGALSLPILRRSQGRRQRPRSRDGLLNDGGDEPTDLALEPSTRVLALTAPCSRTAEGRPVPSTCAKDLPGRAKAEATDGDTLDE